MKDMTERVRLGLVLAAAGVERDVRLSDLTDREIAALARAAIEAMREPTETMRQAGADNLFAAASDDWKEDAGAIWTAMIDAALPRIDGKGE